MKAERTHHDDFNDLIAAAEEALKLALNDGEAKGFKPADWLRESFDNQLGHARAHIVELTRHGPYWAQDEDSVNAIF